MSIKSKLLTESDLKIIENHSKKNQSDMINESEHSESMNGFSEVSNKKGNKI